MTCPRISNFRWWKKYDNLSSLPFNLMRQQVSQLLVYARFVSGNKMKEEFLFCKSLMLTTKAEDVMNIVSKFFQEENLSWEKLIGVCTDGAPSMLGSKSGFVTLVKKKNSAVIT